MRQVRSRAVQSPASFIAALAEACALTGPPSTPPPSRAPWTWCCSGARGLCASRWRQGPTLCRWGARQAGAGLGLGRGPPRSSAPPTAACMLHCSWQSAPRTLLHSHSQPARPVAPAFQSLTLHAVHATVHPTPPASRCWLLARMSSTTAPGCGLEGGWIAFRRPPSGWAAWVWGWNGNVVEQCPQHLSSSHAASGVGAAVGWRTRLRQAADCCLALSLVPTFCSFDLGPAVTPRM